MPFSAKCPFCRLVIQSVPDDLEGGSLECPRCHSFFTLAAALIPSKSEVKKVAAESPTAVTSSPVAVAAPSNSDVSLAPAQEGAPPSAGEIHFDAPLVPLSAEVPAALPRKPAKNYCGALAFLCGSLAVLMISVPPAKALVVPLSAVGVFLGFFGLLWSVWRPAGSLSAVFGLVVSVPVCLLALVRPALLGLSIIPEERADNLPRVVKLRHADEAAIAPRAGEWADAGNQAVQQGDVRVRLASAAIKHVQLEQGRATRVSPQKKLVLRLRISNAGWSRIIEYTGWDQARVRLTDPAKREYRAAVFGPGVRVAGQIGRAELAPAKWVEEVLVFETPPANVESLRLELSLAAFGGSGSLPLEIPRALVVR
jgi:hypothetical protein